MFEEYDRRTRLSERAKRYLLFIPAVIVLCLILGLFALFSNLRSGKEMREIRQMEEKRQALLDSVRVAVVDSGFLRRNVGTRDVYVPMITVQISNISSTAVEDLAVTVFFESKGVFSCQGNQRIHRLPAGETTEASLRCAEPMGFGTLITGVSLSQTMQPVSFSIRILHQDVHATVQRGSATFRLLGIAPPIFPE
jgi:hypothetical protein